MHFRSVHEPPHTVEAVSLEVSVTEELTSPPQIFINFIILCCTGSLAAYQTKYHIAVCASAPPAPPPSFTNSFGPPPRPTAGLVGFTLFLTILLFLLSLLLLVPPLIFDKYDKLGAMARFLREKRAQAILGGGGGGGCGGGGVGLDHIW